MTGYLTSIMTLIEADKWLEQVQSASAGAELESKLTPLAKQVRECLRFDRYDPAVSAVGLPPPSPVRDMGGVGEGISGFAYAGAVGPKFPGAGDILAINQGWVGRTLHRGATRTASKNAGTTRIVLQAMDQAHLQEVISAVNQDGKNDRFFPRTGSPDQQIVTALNQPIRATLLGHLAGIAAHVVLQPYIYARVSAGTLGVDLAGFEVQLDAYVAENYFKRRALHDPARSWSDYLVGDDVAIELIGELYSQAFRRTYGDGPSEPLCAIAPVSDGSLQRQFPGTDAVIAAHPELKDKLARFTGYDALLNSYPEAGRKAIAQALDAVHGLASYLKDYRCAAPAADRAFMVDGYKNTRNWALDAGYDHGPWPYRFLYAGLFVGAVVIVCALIKDNFDVSKTDRIQAWRNGGFFGDEWLVFDCLDQSYGIPGLLLLGVNGLLTAKWIGIFEPGTAGFFDRPTTVLLFKFAKYLVKGAKLLINLTATSFAEKPYVRWPRFLVVDIGLDVIDNLLISTRSVEKGIEGDLPGYQLWKIQWVLAGVCFVACGTAFTVKSTQHDADGTRQSGLQPLELVLAMGVATLGFFICAGAGFFDDKPLQQLVGRPWPANTTAAVDAVHPSSVRLFPTANMQQVGGQDAYPQAPASTPSAARSAADDQARKDGSSELAGHSYPLTDLFQYAAHLAGVLMMAAVAYDTGTTEDKAAVQAVFQDWNLDYRTVDEWNALIETDSSNRMGLARAAVQWQAGASNDPAVLEPLQLAFNVRQKPPAGATHYGRIEDRSVAPNSTRADTAHIYLANTPFTIVNRSGRPVFNGTTDGLGNYSAKLPSGQDYELRVAGYDGVGP